MGYKFNKNWKTPLTLNQIKADIIALLSNKMFLDIRNIRIGRKRFHPEKQNGVVEFDIYASSHTVIPCCIICAYYPSGIEQNLRRIFLTMTGVKNLMCYLKTENSDITLKQLILILAPFFSLSSINNDDKILNSPAFIQLKSPPSNKQ